MEREEPENPNGIMYISANGNYIVLHYKTGPWVQRRESLAYRKRRLNRKIFCKISRSGIVNMLFVKHYCKSGMHICKNDRGLTITLLNKEDLPVTQDFKKRFEKLSSAFSAITRL